MRRRWSPTGLRVLLVWYGPPTAEYAQVVARRDLPLLTELRKLGIELSVVLCGDKGGLEPSLRALSVEVFCASRGLPPAASAVRALPQTAADVRRVVRERRPDIIEGDEPMPAIAVGLATLFQSGRPVRVYRRRHHIGRLRARVASRVATAVTDWTMVSSEAMREYAAKVDGRARERIAIATSGTIDIGRSLDHAGARERAELGVAPDKSLIVAVGRLHRQKGFDMLLRSLAYCRMAARFHVVVIGLGPEADALRALALCSPVPVHLLGHRGDATRWIAGANIVVMSSREETFGRVTVEAMSAGKPLIATAVGGLVDAIVDGETGLIVPPDDLKALARAIDALVSDPERARRMGRQARRRFESMYTMEHMARSWKAAWERALADGGRRQ